MARDKPSPGKHKTTKIQPLAETLPALIERAMAEGRDFILAFETDEETGTRKVHAMSGQFVSACMLRKLIGQAESQKDEGATLISRRWRPGRAR